MLSRVAALRSATPVEERVMSDAGVEPLVKIAQEGAVCTVTLNRPKALNSFTGAMHEELAAALAAAQADRSVRCVVLTGAGRPFCPGQDLPHPPLPPTL